MTSEKEKRKFSKARGGMGRDVCKVMGEVKANGWGPILICERCHSKVLWARWLKRNLIFSQFWRLTV